MQDTGARLIQESDINTADIENRLEQLAKSWDELKQMAEKRWVNIIQYHTWNQQWQGTKNIKILLIMGYGKNKKVALQIT